MVAKYPPMRTLADIVARIGDVPLERVRLRPVPGMATIKDVTRIQEKEGVICELIDGILLEKTVGVREALLAVYLTHVIDGFVRPLNLGLVFGTDATMQILLNLVRIPDVSFVHWDRLESRRVPKEAVPLVVPNLAIEVLSKSNSRKEMAIKRKEYFAAGVELVWEVDPRKLTVAVYTALDAMTLMSLDDTLDGGTVLPGFQLPVKVLFAELDRHG